VWADAANCLILLTTIGFSKVSRVGVRVSVTSVSQIKQLVASAMMGLCYCTTPAFRTHDTRDNN